MTAARRTGRRARIAPVADALVALALLGCERSYSLGSLPAGAVADGSTTPRGLPDGSNEWATDFPSPMFDGTAPAASPGLFGPPSQGDPTGGPCLVEPEDAVLFPQNWLRPRFRWIATQGENLFELRLHVANQIRDLVVYTTSASYTMPVPMWNALRTHSANQPMTLGIRGAVLSGAGGFSRAAWGSRTTMGIAPAEVTGAIVYWATGNTATGSSLLKGFSPGDESVETVLTPAQFAQQQQTTSQCIGCHTSTPDGAFAMFTTTNSLQQQRWSDAIALVDPSAGMVGVAPSYLTGAAAAALARWNQGAATFSPAHWSAGDHRAILSYDNDDASEGGAGGAIGLSWIDLEGADPSRATGTLAREGDTQFAGAPTWSHDGSTVAYVSTNRVCTGRLGNCTTQYEAPQDVGSRADIFVVPYAGGAGGRATPVRGASDASLQEYYPSFSPDDRWLLFNRIPNDANLYSQAAAEVFVVRATGGDAVRLAANDPPVCSGQVSPGLTNSWGKWAPTAVKVGRDTYYWIIFSSRRSHGPPQLYMTAVVEAQDGSVASHGAIYLWNQPTGEANHTPAWDVFRIPSVPR